MRNLLAGAIAGALFVCTGYALASRNSSGTMSAINGPYIPGTTISSAEVNARLSDIENEITDSLSRSGKGGMSAALKEADGTVAAPSYSFTSEPGTGLYRIGASDVGFSVNATKILELTAAGLSVTGTTTSSGAFRAPDGAVGTPGLSFTSETNSGFYRIGASDLGLSMAGVKVLEITGSTATFTDNAVFNGTATFNSTIPTIKLSGAGQATTSFSTSGNLGGSIVLSDSTGAGNSGGAAVFAVLQGSFGVIKGLLTDGTNNTTGQLLFSTRAVNTDATLTERMRITESGITFGGGTAFSNSFKGSFSINPGAIAGNACFESSQTLTGTALGDVCMAGANASLGSGAGNSGAYTCYVAGANTVTFRWCATNGGWTPPNTTYTARTFH